MIKMNNKKKQIKEERNSGELNETISEREKRFFSDDRAKPNQYVPKQDH